METLNFCVATYSLDKGRGIDVTVAEFVKELSKYHGVKLAVITSNMELEGVEITRYPANKPSKMLSVARELDRQHFDFISTQTLPFDAIGSMMKTPHLLHDNGVPPFRWKKHNIAELAHWSEVHAFRLFSVGGVAMALPISEYLSRCLRKQYFYRGRMEVLPAGIEFPDHDPSPAGQEYGKYILFVGRHTPYKGVDQLIEIFGEVRKEIGDDVHLVTIGDADLGYKEYLDKLAQRIGNVHILGYVPDVWRYYAGATVYATCSAWEGEDRPVIEAQYMRKPVVTFNNCSHPEVVHYGTLANDRQMFKDALIRYLSDPKISRSARQWSIDRFATKNVVRKYLDIIAHYNENF